MKNWQDLYKKNLPSYMQIIVEFLYKQGTSSLSVSESLTKLPFTLPKGLKKKEIASTGKYPVVSQSKELIIGYSDDKTKLISNSLPLVVFGDHSKTIKYIDFPFILGADGVKLLKPTPNIYEKYFYYSLIGIKTITKNYGRHFSLLKKKSITVPKRQETQKSIVRFLEDLEGNSLQQEEYFSKKIEEKILQLHQHQLKNEEIIFELSHQSDLLKKLRQQILQEAIEGKLTADWRAENPDVEPARELLEKIKAEKVQLIKEKKIRKQKPLPPISAEEKSFELPEGWEWVRIGQLLNKTSTGPFGSMLHKSDYVPDGIPVVNPANMIDGNIIPSNKMMINQETKERLSKYILKSGEVVIARRGNLSKCAVITKKEEGWLCGSGSFFISPSNYISKIFFVKVYTSPFLQKQLANTSVGQTMANLNQKILKNSLFPLPPLAEQKAIVSKVKKLLSLCDQLETQINENKIHAEKLIQSVLREAFAHPAR